MTGATNLELVTIGVAFPALTCAGCALADRIPRWYSRLTSAVRSARRTPPRRALLPSPRILDLDACDGSVGFGTRSARSTASRNTAPGARTDGPAAAPMGSGRPRRPSH